jgi:acetylornithine/N-succinyldiaminopimelate aminotransferase
MWDFDYIGRMDYKTARDLEAECFASLFNRLPVVLERGQGSNVFDDVGRRYIDAFAGVAVSCVGHNHPRIVETICEQAGRILHTSNWVYNEPQLKLAERLCRISGMERAFFSNDGSGAVEAAFKLARKHTGRKGVIAMEGCFHGRTMGALSATWNERYRSPFEPLIPGFKFAGYDDIGSLRKAIDEDTAAVIVEPILGEAGAICPKPDYLRQVRELTREKGVLLIVDEIQCGLGRAGSWFEYIEAGVEPDIVVSAKGLGAGMPIGALLYQGMDFTPGDHGGTYNGGPLVCSVANTALDIIEDENLVENSRERGGQILRAFRDRGIHGKGLMLGLDVSDGKATALKLLDKGVICIYTGDTLRILPPLNINKGQTKEIIDAVMEVL